MPDVSCLQVREGARWLEREHGDTLKSTWETLKTSFLTAWAMVQKSLSLLINQLWWIFQVKGVLLVLWAVLLQAFKVFSYMFSFPQFFGRETHS